MNTNFKNFIELTDLVQKHGAVALPENFSWVKDIAKLLPGLHLDLPTIEKRAKINIIMDKKNPIYIQLSDGSKLFFSLDEFRRIEGTPKKGKTLIVTMQRLSHDNSDLPSRIVKCQVA